MSAHLREAWAALNLEQYVSVAEQTMERDGHAGQVIQVPTGHRDDPAYQQAIAPLVRRVTAWAGEPVRFTASDYILDTDGGGSQGMVTATGTIVVRPLTNTLTILHEIAHLKTRTHEGLGGHTPAFCQEARDLYRLVLGAEAAEIFWNIVSMHGDFQKHAMPSWRAQGTDYWNDFDCVISTDANGRGRNFEVYTHGKQWASRHSIADAKESVEEVYGPLMWRRIQLPTMSYDHYYFGEIGEEMTDPHSILVADLPRL